MGPLASPSASSTVGLFGRWGRSSSHVNAFWGACRCLPEFLIPSFSVYTLVDVCWLPGLGPELDVYFLFFIFFESIYVCLGVQNPT